MNDSTGRKDSPAGKPRVREVHLGSIVEVVSGGTPSRAKPEYWGGDIPWIKTAQIDYRTVLRADEYITGSGLKNSSARLLPAGTILMAMYGQGKTRGQVARLGIEAAINQACAALLLKPGVDLHYIYYQLAYLYPKIRALSNSGNQDNLSSNLIRSIKVTLLPLPEQEKVGQVLSASDEAIEKTTELIDAKQRQKKALMQQLLSGKRRVSGFEGEWRSRRLSDLFERVTRKNTRGCDNNLTISGSLGLINQEEYFSKRIASRDASGYFLLKRGEFAYNKSSSHGYPLGAIKMLSKYDEGVVSTLYICFRLQRGAANPEFARLYFESGALNHEVYKIAQEGARHHGLLNVTPADFFNTEVIFPDMEEQESITAVLAAAEDGLAALDRRLAALKQQKKSLMQKLLTGQIRVKV